MNIKPGANLRTNNQLSIVPVLIVAIVTSMACNNSLKSIEVKEKPLALYKSTSRSYDSLPLNSVRAIAVLDNKVFVGDRTNQRILELDAELNWVKTIAIGGKGPCEVISPLQMVIGGNELYVYDFANKRFNIHSTVNSTCENKTIKGRIMTSFDYYNSQLILSTVSKENTMAFYDPESGITKPFGLLKESPINSNKFIYNHRHVVVNSKGLIFALPEGIPVMEVYNQEGKLLGEHSLSDIPPIASRIEYAKTNSLTSKHKPNTVYILYGFVAKKNERLFLLATDHLENNEVQNNTLLVFNIQNETPLWEGWYRLNPEAKMDTWYSAFDIMGDEIIAFESVSGEFHRFELPDY